MLEFITVLLVFCGTIALLIRIQNCKTYDGRPKKPPQGYAPTPIIGVKSERNPPIGRSNIRYKKDKEYNE